MANIFVIGSTAVSNLLGLFSTCLGRSEIPKEDLDPPLAAHAKEMGLCPDRSFCRETTLRRHPNDGNVTVSIDGMSARKEDTNETGYVDEGHMRVNKVLAIHYPNNEMKTAKLCVEIECHGERKIQWFKAQDIRGVTGSVDAIETFKPSFR